MRILCFPSFTSSISFSNFFREVKKFEDEQKLEEREERKINNVSNSITISKKFESYRWILFSSWEMSSRQGNNTEREKKREKMRGNEEEEEKSIVLDTKQNREMWSWFSSLERAIKDRTDDRTSSDLFFFSSFSWFFQSLSLIFFFRFCGR